MVSQNKRTNKDGSKLPTLRICSGCRDLDTSRANLMKCGKCKAISYCSKECQKADWKIHKGLCELAMDSAQNASFSARICKNGVLDSSAQRILALYLDIPAGGVSPDQLCKCRLRVAFEPDYNSLRAMHDGKPLPPNTQGFFQILGVTCAIPDMSKPSEDLTVWRKFKEIDANADAFAIFTEYINQGDELATASLVRLEPSVIELAREDMREARRSKPSATPYEVRSTATMNAVRYFNNKIRRDTENKFKMRKILTPSDVKLVEQAIVDLEM